MVVNKHSNPCSYNIRTNTGTTLRRNRPHLRKTSEMPPAAASVLDDFTYDDPSPLVTDEHPAAPQANEPTERCTRSGRIVRLPVRFRNNSFDC